MTKGGWTFVMALVALLAAVVAVGFAVGAMRPAPPKPAPVTPLGVCVVTDPYAFGTDGGGPYAAVRSVTSAVRVNGVVTCEAGTYVSVTPH